MRETGWAETGQPEEEDRGFGRERRESWANGEKREKGPANRNRERRKGERARSGGRRT